MSTLRSVWAWAVFSVFIFLVIPAIVVGMALLPRHIVYWYAAGSCRILLPLAGVRVRVTGVESWDTERGYVIMGNHVNFMDPFILAAALPRFFIGIEKRQNFKIPLYGWLIAKWGNVALDRDNRVAAIKQLEEAAQSLDRAEWIVIMPEGTRTRNGKLGPFKKGGFHMAVSSGVPIAPFTQVGSWEVLRTGSWRISPGEIEFICHPPIDTAAYGVDRMEGLMADVRRVIAGPLGEAEEQPVPEPVGADAHG